ncbi:hypothetical protein CR513_61679, partial [Mucuna pruriens]
MVLENFLRFGFKSSNNQVEYEALLTSLKLALEFATVTLSWQLDTSFVLTRLGSFSCLKHIPREENVQVDLLSKLASTKKPRQHRTVIQK